MSYPANKMSPDFNTFFSTQKGRITRYLKSIGCTDIVFNKGFYYFSAFFTSATGQVYYLCTFDYRGTDDRFYYRTAKDYKDYTGGANRSASLKDLHSMLIK